MVEKYVPEKIQKENITLVLFKLKQEIGHSSNTNQVLRNCSMEDFTTIWYAAGWDALSITSFSIRSGFLAAILHPW